MLQLTFGYKEMFIQKVSAISLMWQVLMLNWLRRNLKDKSTWMHFCLHQNGVVLSVNKSFHKFHKDKPFKGIIYAALALSQLNFKLTAYSQVHKSLILLLIYEKKLSYPS